MADDKFDPFKTKGNGYVSPTTPAESPEQALKRKQRKSIEGEFNQEDAVGDFVRRVIGGNKEKKQSGF